jgi:hypothetical protein
MLIYASIYGNYELVKGFLDEGTDIHIRNDVALRNVANECHLKLVQRLIDKGVDIT